MIAYKVWTRIGDAEWGNEPMDRKAAEVSAVVPERPLLVSVQEHGGWWLVYAFGVAGVDDGGIVDSANDCAVFPAAVNAFWRAMKDSSFITLWECQACGRLAVLHRSASLLNRPDEPRMVCGRCGPIVACAAN